MKQSVVLQVSNANTFVAERLSWFLGCQIEKAIDELNLTSKIISCHPSNLPFPDHVDCFVALNRSPGRLECSEALLGIHSIFDGSMNLVRECCLSTAPVGVDRVRSIPSFLLSGIAEL